MLVASTLLFASCDDDDDKKEFKPGDKEGILLVTFGSSYEAPQATFANMDQAAKATFVGEEIRWGFTSDLILNILRKGEGENGIQKDNDTPQEALKKMAEEGYGKFTVQSLHVIPGEEFDELVEAVEDFKDEYEGVEVSVGRPLLDTDADITAVATVMAAKFAAEVTDGPVLFMGHGTPHEADNRYAKLETELQKINANFFVGTVEGIGFEKEGTEGTSIGSILERVNAISPKPTTVTISPLMSIAGDHANNDMNGNTGETVVEEQSWRERLVGAGYTVECVMKGLGDYNEINAIWMSHLQTAKK